MKLLLNIPSAIQILKQGGIIAYPTETFYGLGCNATNVQAVKKLFAIKGRASNIPIPILIGEMNQLSLYVEEVPEIAKKLIKKFWPGPLTLIFRAKNIFPKELLAGSSKIAIRISSHSIALKLTRGFGLPLTTTSANRSGESPASDVNQVEKYFENKIDGILDGGKLSAEKGSTVLDITTDPPKIVREGMISSKDLDI